MNRNWYKEGVVYQIYPRSYKDSNNDGCGDLKGIIEKLDYIKSLGVSIVWLSPIYASPMDDNGYDISDYYSINKEYGTMEDFKELLSGIHNRGMKLIMDLVINHTSDEHYWFQESRKSKDNPYRDFYIWKEGKKGKNPNNWTSYFGGDAWAYDELTKEYYLHLFSPKQPDLNWDNPKVREEIKKMIKFWLDMGVDGFRCDVINLISKTPGLPNGKPALFLRGNELYANGPKIHEYLQEIKKDVFDHYDMFTVGEMAVSPEVALTYIANDIQEMNMIINFDHINCDNFLVKWFIKKFKPKNLKKALTKWQKAINGKGWNCLYIESHDQPRCVSRFGSEEYRKESAKMIATLIFFMQGTPFIYQGQEIGMTNPHFKSLDDYKDVETHNVYKMGKKMFHFTHKRMMKKIEYMSRDNARTPMQWNQSINAGFTESEPWIKVNKNYPEVNVQNEENDPKSVLAFYKKLIALRKEFDVITYGDYIDHYPRSNKIVCYERNLENEKLLIVCNYTSKERKIKLPYDVSNGELILNNYDSDDVCYKPYQAKVYIIRKEDK